MSALPTSVRSWMPRAFGAIAAILVLAASEAVAQTPVAPASEKAPARLAEGSARRGLLYEIKSDAGTVYLFGTIHVGKPEFYPLDAKVNNAFAASSALYLEVNLSDASLVTNASTMATYPEGT